MWRTAGDGQPAELDDVGPTPSVGLAGAVPVEPALGQNGTEGLQRLRQEGRIALSALHERPRHRVVDPSARVFHVEHVVPEAGEAEGPLQIVPEHASERVGGGQASDGDTQAFRHGSGVGRNGQW